MPLHPAKLNSKFSYSKILPPCFIFIFVPRSVFFLTFYHERKEKTRTRVCITISTSNSLYVFFHTVFSFSRIFSYNNFLMYLAPQKRFRDFVTRDHRVSFTSMYISRESLQFQWLPCRLLSICRFLDGCCSIGRSFSTFDSWG